MKKLLFLLALLVPFAFANTPGKHYVVLTWIDADASVVSYNVYRGTATGVCSGTPTPYFTGATAKTYTDNFVTTGTTYFYAVTAVDSTGSESSCSNEASATIPLGPSTPSGLSATAH